jgi:uncharacterized protein involved in response to NO
MDMDVVLAVGSLMAFVVAAVRWRRNPLTRPASSGVLWFAAGLFAMQVVDLSGVRDGVPLYLLGVGGLSCFVLGVYKISEYLRSRSESESQER